MRRIFSLCFVIGLICLLGGLADAQDFGGGGKKGKGGGKGGFGGGGPPDPGAMFDRFANGSSTLTKDMLPGPMQGMWDMFANGKTSLTRQDFVDSAATFQQKMGGGNRGGGTGGTGGPGGGGAPGGGGGFDVDASAERRFQRMDQDGDGRLSFEEMGEELQAVKDKYDSNKDGFISLDEFKHYWRDRMAERMAQNGGAKPQDGDHSKDDSAAANLPGGTHPEEDARPKILRAGKLTNLPSWYVQMDQNGDNDGQVGLYEWRQAGQPISEFANWDLNDDGFITPEEVLKVLKSQGKDTSHGNNSVGSELAQEDSNTVPFVMGSGTSGTNGFNRGGGPGGFGGGSGRGPGGSGGDQRQGRGGPGGTDGGQRPMRGGPGGGTDSPGQRGGGRGGPPGSGGGDTPNTRGGGRGPGGGRGGPGGPDAGTPGGRGNRPIGDAPGTVNREE